MLLPRIATPSTLGGCLRPPCRQLATMRRHAGGNSSAGGGTADVAAAAAAGPSGYWTIAQEQFLEVEVKKSRFLVTSWPVQSGEEAMRLIREASDSSASHNCWAWKVGASYRSSDDGEPGGTAGRPILGAIEGDGLDGVCVLVTRFFGGIKLGSGGLVRAYGGAARDCLRAAPKAFVKRRLALRITAPYSLLGTVYATLSRHGGEAAGEEAYTESGDVRVVFLVDADAAAVAADAVANATSGKVVPQIAAEDEEEEEGGE